MYSYSVLYKTTALNRDKEAYPTMVLAHDDETMTGEQRASDRGYSLESLVRAIDRRLASTVVSRLCPKHTLYAGFPVPEPMRSLINLFGICS
jgi:hypothetical protein